MIVGGVIDIDEAYHGLDWRTIFLLAGLIPLGIATEKTGAAAWLAQNILALVGTPSEYIFLLIVATITTLFTLVISNVGAAVLLLGAATNTDGQEFVMSEQFYEGGDINWQFMLV